MKQLLMVLIKAYQYLISPSLGNNRRHGPSCSQYMVEVMKDWAWSKARG